MELVQSTMTAVGWLGFFNTKIMGLWGAALSSPVVLSLGLRILNKIPLNPWFKLLEGVGNTISTLGNLRLPKVLWEPFEEWFQKFLVGSVNAIDRGMDMDDPEPKEEASK